MDAGLHPLQESKSILSILMLCSWYEQVPIQVHRSLAYSDGIRPVEPARMAVAAGLSEGLLFTELDRYFRKCTYCCRWLCDSIMWCNNCSCSSGFLWFMFAHKLFIYILPQIIPQTNKICTLELWCQGSGGGRSSDKNC